MVSRTYSAARTSPLAALFSIDMAIASCIVMFFPLIAAMLLIRSISAFFPFLRGIDNNCSRVSLMALFSLFALPDAIPPFRPFSLLSSGVMFANSFFAIIITPLIKRYIAFQYKLCLFMPFLLFLEL